jgi:hypothetical protein
MHSVIVCSPVLVRTKHHRICPNQTAPIGLSTQNYNSLVRTKHTVPREDTTVKMGYFDDHFEEIIMEQFEADLAAEAAEEAEAEAEAQADAEAEAAEAEAEAEAEAQAQADAEAEGDSQG